MTPHRARRERKITVRRSRDEVRQCSKSCTRNDALIGESMKAVQHMWHAHKRCQSWRAKPGSTCMDSPFHLKMSSAATCSARGRTEKIKHVEGKRELPPKPPKAAEEAAFEMLHLRCACQTMHHGLPKRRRCPSAAEASCRSKLQMSI